MDSKKTIYVASPIWPSNREPSLGTFVKTISDGLEQFGWKINTSCVGRTRYGGQFGKAVRYSKLCVGLLTLIFKKKGILYIHLPTWFALFCWPAVLIRKFPLVINLHGSEIHSRRHLSKITWPLTKKLLKNANLVISPSDTFKRRVENEIPGINVFVSPSGGVDADVFKILSKEHCREIVGIRRDVPVIGYVSRIVPGKGWKIFLEILHDLISCDENFIGLIVGDGFERIQMLKEITNLKLENNIFFAGAVEHKDISTYMSSFDAFIFCSKIEDVDTLGLVAIEAMACGTPVVALDTKLTREYIIPGLSGELASEYDSHSFISAIKRAMKICRESENARYDISESVKDYRSISVSSHLSEAIEKACNNV